MRLELSEKIVNAMSNADAVESGTQKQREPV